MLNAQVVLPQPEQPFKGKTGRTVKGSTPDFPKGVEAPERTPNVLLIMTDDVGFGASSTFGGPIQTPTFQRLADSGLRYSMYHTTALCSPTRAALIAGRNHHSCASGMITEMATGYPGYNSLVPKSCGSVGEVLRENGYNTSWFGKMHNVPDWMSSRAGPFDLWPSGLGFEYFYGFIGGDSDQWHPALYENTTPIEPYLSKPDYILDHDLADKAITWMRTQHALASHKPWFLHVYPLDSSFAARVDPAIRPSLTRGRNEFTYYPGMIRIPERSAPDFKNKSWTVAAEITVSEGGANGILATMGGRFGGWGLWIADNKPHFAHALSNQPQHKFNVASDQTLSPGNHLVRVKFEYDGGGLAKGGTATLFVDEKQVAQGRIPQTVMVRFSFDETFDVGEDTGTPVVEDYVDKMPYAFTGTLKKVAVILEPEKLTTEDRERLRREAARAYLAVQ